MSVTAAKGSVAAVLHAGIRHSKLDIANGKGTARRDIEGAGEIVEFSLPAVITIDEGIARPRYPSLKGIMAAKKKPMETKPAQLGNVRVTVKSMELPPDRPAVVHARAGPIDVEQPDHTHVQAVDPLALEQQRLRAALALIVGGTGAGAG